MLQISVFHCTWEGLATSQIQNLLPFFYRYPLVYILQKKVSRPTINQEAAVFSRCLISRMRAYVGRLSRYIPKLPALGNESSILCKTKKWRRSI